MVRSFLLYSLIDCIIDAVESNILESCTSVDTEFHVGRKFTLLETSEDAKTINGKVVRFDKNDSRYPYMVYGYILPEADFDRTWIDPRTVTRVIS